MSRYVPKFHENNRDLLILDNLFAAEDCVDYASKHNMSVLLTETTSTSSVEVMAKFKNKGYNIELMEKKVHAPDGIELNPKIYVLFTKENTSNDENNKIKMTLDELNKRYAELKHTSECLEQAMKKFEGTDDVENYLDYKMLRIAKECV